MPPPPPYPLRPLALEYRVSGLLDGVTPSPQTPLPPAAGSPVVPTLNKVVIDVVNLGLIDLTGLPGAQGQYADRLLKWVVIYGPNVPFAPDSVGISFDGVSEGTDLSIPAVANGIRSYNCLFVPQSGQLRVNGMAASPGEPVIVRLGVWQPQSLLELTDMIDACCCLAGGTDDLGQPFFNQAIYAPGACARSVSAALPVSAAQGAGAVVVTLTGTGFTSSDVVAFVSTDGTTSIPVTSVVAPTSISMLVTINIGPGQAVGDYDITVAAPLGGPGCSDTLEAGFAVT